MNIKKFKCFVLAIAFISIVNIFTAAQTAKMAVVTRKISRAERGFAINSELRKVDKPRVTVRASPNGYAIGTLLKTNKRQDKFRLDDVRQKGKWGVGFAGGNVRQQGWVLMDGLKSGTRPRPDNPRDPILRGDDARKFLLSKYASLINSRKNGSPAKDGSAAKLVSPTRGFQNFDFRRGIPRDPISPTRFNSNDPLQRFKWRFVTKDGRYVMGKTFKVNDNGKRITSNAWLFVKCGAVSPRFGGNLPCRK